MAQTEFAIVPTAEDIANLDRDLRFYEVSNADPSVLTSDQIDAYNRQGYLKGFRVFSSEFIDSIRHK